MCTCYSLKLGHVFVRNIFSLTKVLLSYTETDTDLPEIYKKIEI